MKKLMPNGKKKFMDKLTVLKFSASWCGPCRAYKPQWEGIVKANENPNIEYVSVDVDSQELVAQLHDIRAIPAFVFLKGGKEVYRQVGVPSTKLNELAEQHLKA